MKRWNDDSDGTVNVLYSAVCSYPQVYRHQEVLQKVGVTLCMPNGKSLCFLCIYIQNPTIYRLA